MIFGLTSRVATNNTEIVGLSKSKRRGPNHNLVGASSFSQG